MNMKKAVEQVALGRKEIPAAKVLDLQEVEEQDRAGQKEAELEVQEIPELVRQEPALLEGVLPEVLLPGAAQEEETDEILSLDL